MDTLRGKQVGLDALDGTATGYSTPIAVSEPVLTISQIAERLQIDRHVVTRLFASERGVICFGNSETQRGRRKYRTLRVPVSVFNRVVARLSNK